MKNGISVFKFIYYNYFCKNVVRHGKGRLIPYKNSILDFAKGSQIHLYDKDVHVGTNKLKHSKRETDIRLKKNAVWQAKGYCEISYGATIEVLESALLETGNFTINSNSTLIAEEKVTIGNDVMIARNVIIYDSNFHPIKSDGIISQKCKPVTIENHVWIGAGSMVLKGVVIGKNSIIAAGTLLTASVPSDTILGNEHKQVPIKIGNIEWKR